MIVGLSRAGSYALIPLLVIYLLLLVCILLGGWPESGHRPQTRLFYLITLLTAVFAALWLSGGLLWSLFFWLSAGERYLRYATWTAGFTALAISSTVLIRMVTGRVDRCYCRVLSLGSGLCVALLGAFYLLEIVSNIDGWTARGAVENVYAFLMEGSDIHPAHLARRVVEETSPTQIVRGGKAFAIYVGDTRVAEVQVTPYYRWWWKHGYSRYSPRGLDVDVQAQVRSP